MCSCAFSQLQLRKQACFVWSLLIFNIAGKLQAGGERKFSFLFWECFKIFSHKWILSLYDKIFLRNFTENMD